MKKYIMALDEGTTSTRAIIFDENADIVGVTQHEFRQIYPQPGWVEHDASEIFSNQYNCMLECLEKTGIALEQIAGIGITNQRETAVVWNKKTGKPIYNAIVWQCRRTADICDELEKEGLGDYIAGVTGLRPDAYFSGPKIKWILDNVEGAKEAAEKGELLFGTIDTWLIWNLTGGNIHVTDRTNASRTMLYDISRDTWSQELLDRLGIPASMLPEVKSSSEIYGYAEISGVKIPICGIAGDQQAALFGQCCFEPGDIKNTYGTGCFLLANTGAERITSKNGLITTLAATEKGKPIEYVLEGSVFIGGAVIQWVRDELKLISSAAESEKRALSVPDNAGVYIVPAFSGLGAPYWDMRARGAVFGLTRGAGADHIIRASLESIVYQTEDVICAMQADFGKPLTELKVDGGAAVNNFLVQFQSDISDIKVYRPSDLEATAKGAAFLAGLAVGFFKDRNDIADKVKIERAFEPQMDINEREKLLAGWHRAVKACKEF